MFKPSRLIYKEIRSVDDAAELASDKLEAVTSYLVEVVQEQVGAVDGVRRGTHQMVEGVMKGVGEAARTPFKAVWKGILGGPRETMKTYGEGKWVQATAFALPNLALGAVNTVTYGLGGVANSILKVAGVEVVKGEKKLRLSERSGIARGLITWIGAIKKSARGLFGKRLAKKVLGEPSTGTSDSLVMPYLPAGAANTAPSAPASTGSTRAAA